MSAVAPRAPTHGVDELQQEHQVVLRMWGRLQHRLGAQLQQQAAEQARWQGEVMRLRAALMLTRTAVLWGMGLADTLPIRRVATPDPCTSPVVSPNQHPVDGVLCLTACVGHAHHWLDNDERCTRTGQPCHRVASGN